MFRKAELILYATIGVVACTVGLSSIGINKANVLAAKLVYRALQAEYRSVSPSDVAVLQSPAIHGHSYPIYAAEVLYSTDLVTARFVLSRATAELPERRVLLETLWGLKLWHEGLYEEACSQWLQLGPYAHTQMLAVGARALERQAWSELASALSCLRQSADRNDLGFTALAVTSAGPLSGAGHARVALEALEAASKHTRDYSELWHLFRQIGLIYQSQQEWGPAYCAFWRARLCAQKLPDTAVRVDMVQGMENHMSAVRPNLPEVPDCSQGED